jgi:hypothetical protein
MLNYFLGFSEGNVSPRRAAADYTSAMSERAAAEVDSYVYKIVRAGDRL